MKILDCRLLQILLGALRVKCLCYTSVYSTISDDSVSEGIDPDQTMNAQADLGLPCPDIAQSDYQLVIY